MTDTKYFSHSWALLTRDRGWIKPVLVLAVSMFIPIVGPLAVWGYALEWARLTAWNVDAAPKQRGVKIGACIASGWRALVVLLVWALLWGVATAVVQAVVAMLGIRLLSELLSIAITVGEVFLSLVILVAALRAAIYERITAGLSFSRVFEMVSRDPSGLFKNVAIPIVTSLIAGAIGLVGCLVLVTAVMPDIMQVIYEVEYLGVSGSSDASLLISAIGSILRVALPAGVLIGYVGLVFSVAGNLLLTNAIGLWMRQFDVPRWGTPGDPLPSAPTALPPAAPSSPAYAAPMPAPAPAPQQLVPAPSPQPSRQVGLNPSAARPQGTSVPSQPTVTPVSNGEVPPTRAQDAEGSETQDGEVIVPLTRPRPSADDSKDVPPAR